MKARFEVHRKEARCAEVTDFVSMHNKYADTLYLLEALLISRGMYLLQFKQVSLAQFLHLKGVPVLLLLLAMTSSQALTAQKYLDMIEAGTYPFVEIQQEANTYFSHHDKATGSGYKQYKRWEFDAVRSLDSKGYVIDELTLYAISTQYNQNLNHALLNRSSPCNADWQPVGPYAVNGSVDYDPGIGRITSCAFDPSDQLHIIAGAETGGVWRTVDGGLSWEPLSDDISSLDVSSLAIDPLHPEIYYWGVSYGLLFKSTNSGTTWEEITYDGRGAIEAILINPHNPQELWLADQSFGIFHSTDGGYVWERLTQDGCLDLTFHPENPDIIYASGTGVWRSNDGGKTFEELEFPFQNNESILIDVSKAAPDNLYLLQSDGRQLEGLYVSRNTGENIQPLYSGDMNLLGYDHLGRDARGQAPRNMAMAVSDVDSNIIFVAGINVWRSVDAGTSFKVVTYYNYGHSVADAGYCHADIEMLKIENEHLYIGSDGGLFVLDDIATTSITHTSIRDLTKGMNIRQIYRIGIADGPEEIMSIGAQDNGTALLYDETWKYYFGGDGTETFISHAPEGLVLFASLQHGSLTYSIDTGQTTTPVPGTYPLHGSGKWITPFLKDPNDPQTIYAGFDRVYRSTDLGQTIEPISHAFYPSVISIAPSGSDTIYGGSANQVYRTTDGGITTTWDRILYANVNTGEIVDIAVHPRDADLVAVAVSGGTNIWLTRDGGQRWEAWDQGLSPAPTLSLVWQDNDMESIYLGTSIGVFYRDKNSTDWIPFQFGMPIVKVNELEVRKETGQLYAATYGRGVWVSPLCDFSSASHESSLLPTIRVIPNPVQVGERITIQNEERVVMDVLLYDAQGRILSKVEDQFTATITCYAPASTGIYFLRFQSKEGMTTTKLVVVD